MKILNYIIENCIVREHQMPSYLFVVLSVNFRLMEQTPFYRFERINTQRLTINNYITL